MTPATLVTDPATIEAGRVGPATGVIWLELADTAFPMRGWNDFVVVITGAAPRATFGGGLLHATVAEMAAAYLFHVVRNHPFVDGNERAGLAAAIAFLGVNDLWLEADPDELVELVMGVAAGRVGKAEVAVFLGRHVTRLADG